MVKRSRLQTMQLSCWVSGTQSLRAGGCGGGWNCPSARRLRPADTRSLSRSALLTEEVCVGVLPAKGWRGTQQKPGAVSIHPERGLR